MLSEDEKAKLANRLRRIAGQVSAVQRMMDEDAYCVDILTQIAAAGCHGHTAAGVALRSQTRGTGDHSMPTPG